MFTPIHTSICKGALKTWGGIKVRQRSLFEGTDSSREIPVYRDTVSNRVNFQADHVLNSNTMCRLGPDEVYIFHGTSVANSVRIMENGINVSLSFPESDFGRAFYCTLSFDEACNWATRKGDKEIVVLVFKIPEDTLWASCLKLDSQDSTKKWISLVSRFKQLKISEISTLSLSK